MSLDQQLLFVTKWVANVIVNLTLLLVLNVIPVKMVFSIFQIFRFRIQNIRGPPAQAWSWGQPGPNGTPYVALGALAPEIHPRLREM